MKVRFWGVRGSLPVPGAQDRALRRQHLVRRGPLGGGHARRHRRRHRHPQARQGAGRRRRGRPRATSTCSSATPTGTTSRGCRSSRRSTSAATRCPSTRASATTCTCGRCSRRRPTIPYFPVPFDEAEADIAFRELIEGAVRDRRRARSRARGSTTRRSRSPTASTADGASVVYVSDTAPFTDILFEDEFIARPPTPGAELPADGPAEARGACATAWSAVRGRRPRHLRHAVHARGVPAHPALGPLAPGGRDRDRREAGARAAGAVPPRARAHRRRDRRDPRRHARDAAKRARIALDVVAAYEGLDVELGQRLMELDVLGRARLDPGAGAGDRALRRQHRRACRCAPSGGGLIILDCGTGRAQPRHQR